MGHEDRNTELRIVVLYSCPLCGLHKSPCQVKARGDEDVLAWMDAAILQLCDDHRVKSPHCHPKELKDIMIPLTATDRVGGPPRQ